jgi:shikimate kinase
LEKTIILIGPMSAGKSAVGRLLAERLGLEQIELDEIRWDYFNEIGYDEDEVRRIMTTGNGVLEMLAYWKPFEVHAVERVLADHQNCVIDFGAGYTVQEDEVLFGRIQQALAPFSYVILLLPSPDPRESITILNKRLAEMLSAHDQPQEQIAQVLQVNEGFVTHPSNGRLAKMTVYSKGKTAEETCGDIMRLIT